MPFGRPVRNSFVSILPFLGVACGRGVALRGKGGAAAIAPIPAQIVTLSAPPAYIGVSSWGVDHNSGYWCLAVLWRKIKRRNASEDVLPPLRLSFRKASTRLPTLATAPCSGVRKRSFRKGVLVGTCLVFPGTFLFSETPDVHKIVLAIKIAFPPPPEKVSILRNFY